MVDDDDSGAVGGEAGQSGGGSENVDVRRRREQRELVAQLTRLTGRIAGKHRLEHNEAEDLNQEVLFEYFKRKGSGPADAHDRSEALKLTAKIGRHRALNILRSVHRLDPDDERPEVDLDELLCPRADPAAQLESRELFEIIGRCLNRMSKERREVFLMRAVDGLEPAEVAEKQGITVDAVLKSLKRAGHQLRREVLDFLG